MSPDTFPTFFYDANTGFGLIESVEDWEALLSKYCKDPQEHWYEDREGALKHILAAKEMARPEARSWEYETPDGEKKTDTFGMKAEQWGQVANFGYRREHTFGKVTLGEWLRAKGWLGRLTGSEPGELVQ